MRPDNYGIWKSDTGDTCVIWWVRGSHAQVTVLDEDYNVVATVTAASIRGAVSHLEDALQGTWSHVQPPTGSNVRHMTNEQAGAHSDTTRFIADFLREEAERIRQSLADAQRDARDPQCGASQAYGRLMGRCELSAEYLENWARQMEGGDEE